MFEPLERASERLAENTSRRGFLSKVGRALVLVAGGGAVATAIGRQESADAFHICGHTYTTGSCPHPSGLPRVDSKGYPLRSDSGQPIDDLGRNVDSAGRPVDGEGGLLLDPDGRPLPPGPRSTLCHTTGERFGFDTSIDGAWYRCCGGQVRKLWDCCSYNSKRINGDAALTGYCYAGRTVFCVMYFQTKVPC